MQKLPTPKLSTDEAIKAAHAKAAALKVAQPAQPAQAPKAKNQTIVGVVATVAFIAIMVWSHFETAANTAEPVKAAPVAKVSAENPPVYVVQQAAKRLANHPATVDFKWNWGGTKSGGVWKISGSFTAKNSFGVSDEYGVLANVTGQAGNRNVKITSIWKK